MSLLSAIDTRARGKLIAHPPATFQQGDPQAAGVQEHHATINGRGNRIPQKG
jgi:hypothetical protein